MNGEFGNETSVVTLGLVQDKLNDLGFVLESEYRNRVNEFPSSEPINLGDIRGRLNIPTEVLANGGDLYQLEIWIETVEGLGVGGILSATSLEELNDTLYRAVDHVFAYMQANGFGVGDSELN